MTHPHYNQEPDRTASPYYGNQPPTQPYVGDAPRYQDHLPRKKGMPTWVKVLLTIGIVSLLLCGGGFVACTAFVDKAATDASNNLEAEKAAKTSGVKVTKCDTSKAKDDVFPHVIVTLEIVNTTKDQQTYFIDLFIKDKKSGVRVSNGSAMVSDVRPGQKVTHKEQVHLTSDVKAGTVLECSVDKVS